MTSMAVVIRSGLWTVGLILVVLATSCDRVTPTSAISLPAGTAQVASGVAWSQWSTPVNLREINSSVQDRQPTLSPDGLSLYFTSRRPGGLGVDDIWVSHRATGDGAWQTPQNLGQPVNSSSEDRGPCLSNDGHLLFFFSDRPGGQGGPDIYVSHRTLVHDDFNWTSPVNLGLDVNTSQYEAGPDYLQPIEDGPINLYFGRGPDGVAIDIYAAAIDRNGETRGPATPVSELNFAVAGITDAKTSVSRDGKEVIFFSTRPGGFGLADLYVSTRPTIYSEWSPPVNLGQPINTEYADTEPWLSFDGETLLFASNRPGGLGLVDLWMSTRKRIPHANVSTPDRRENGGVLR